MDRWQMILLAVLLVNLLLQSDCEIHNRTTYELKGKPDGGYYVSMDIGSPPTRFNVLIDTGSSNFAIAAYNNPNITRYFDYQKSHTYSDGNQDIELRYSQGHWKGKLGSDKAQLSNGLIASHKVNITLITESQDFFMNGSDWQGILGLGYKDIAQPTANRPTPFFDTLVNSGLVSNTFSLQLCGPGDGPFSDDIPVGGKLVIGDDDPALYTGELFSAAIVKEDYFRLLVTDIKIGGDSLGMDCIDYNTDKTIIDCGTTNLKLPVNVFNFLAAHLKTKVEPVANVTWSWAFWTGLDPICMDHSGDGTLSMYNQFPNIDIDLYTSDGEAITLSVSPQQYLRPVPEPKPEPGEQPRDCYKVGISSSSEGTNIGAVIMEGYYVHHDRHDKTVSFAQTTCPPRVTGAPVSRVYKSNSTRKHTKSDCMFVRKNRKTLPTYAIVLIVIFSGLLIVGLTIAVVKLVRRSRYNKARQLRNEIDIHDLMEDTFDTEY